MTRSTTSVPDPDGPRPRRRARRPDDDRRPYPTAPTLTRPSPARPDTTRRRRATGPIPSTVWLCDPTASPGLAVEPSPLAAVIAAAVTSFSAPRERVGILAWPHPAAADRARPPQPPDEIAPTMGAVAGTTAGDSFDPRSAATVIATEGRIPVVLRFASVAELGDERAIGAHDRTALAVASPNPAETDGADVHRLAHGDGPAAPVDLMITAVGPDDVDDATATCVTLAAAAALRRGGVLVVFTHCDVRQGVLVNPGGVLVTAGQNADLLYLQHIVAVHAPIRDGHIHPAPGSAATDPALHGAADGRPVRHERVHSDVYILAQQRDHHQPDSNRDPALSGTAAEPTLGS